MSVFLLYQNVRKNFDAAAGPRINKISSLLSRGVISRRCPLGHSPYIHFKLKLNRVESKVFRGIRIGINLDKRLHRWKRGRIVVQRIGPLPPEAKVDFAWRLMTTRWKRRSRYPLISNFIYADMKRVIGMMPSTTSAKLKRTSGAMKTPSSSKGWPRRRFKRARRRL